MSYNLPMPPAPGATRAVGMVPDEMKAEPKSKGLTTPRKKKPKELAVITECCTGCAGSPACVEYCPVEDCMFWVAVPGTPSSWSTPPKWKKKSARWQFEGSGQWAVASRLGSVVFC